MQYDEKRLTRIVATDCGSTTTTKSSMMSFWSTFSIIILIITHIAASFSES